MNVHRTHTHATRTFLGALACLASLVLVTSAMAEPEGAPVTLDQSCTSSASSNTGDAFTLAWDQTTCDYASSNDVQTQLCWKPVGSAHTLCHWKSGTITKKNQEHGSYEFTGKTPCTKYKWQVNYWDSDNSTWREIPQAGDGTITTEGKCSTES